MSTDLPKLIAMRGGEFAELRAFVAIAQEASFRKAAERLALTPSALSHTIRALEERLGTKLFHRTTRSVACTEAGRALLGRVLPAMAELDAAVGQATSFASSPRGRLRINLPRQAAEMVISPRLTEFADRYPDVVIDLTVDDVLTDIVGEGFDAGIRPGERVQIDMVAVRLTGDLSPVIIASPGYIAKKGSPTSPQDLHAHRCINYRWAHSGAPYSWKLVQEANVLDVVVDASLTCNDAGLLVNAAISGLGITYVVEDVVTEHIAAGRLVRVLEDWCRPVPGFHLYYSGRRHVSPPLRAFIDFFRYRP